MARPLRIDLAAGLYQVTSRGDRREDIYRDEKDRGRARRNRREPTQSGYGVRSCIPAFSCFQLALSVYSSGMARPLRIDLAAGLYQVTSRGDRREDIYRDEKDRGRARRNRREPESSTKGLLQARRSGYVGARRPAPSMMNYAGHAVVGCASAEAQGGNCARGAAAQLASKWATIKTDGMKWSTEQQFVAATVVGGSVSVIGGGKFANGALTGTAGYLFNQFFFPRQRNIVLDNADRAAGLNPSTEGIRAFEDAVFEAFRMPSGRAAWADYLNTQASIFSGFSLIVLTHPLTVPTSIVFSSTAVTFDAVSQMIHPAPEKLLLKISIDLSAQTLPKHPIKGPAVWLIKEVVNQMP